MQVRRTWWRGNNEEFLGRVSRLAQKRKWGQLVKAFRTALDKVAAAQGEADAPAAAAGAAAEAAAQQPAEGSGSKKQKRGSSGKKGGKASGAALPAEVVRQWQAFGSDLAAAEAAATAAEGGFAFAFVEGALVKAVQEGWWLLLDEMNLAPAEVSRGRGGDLAVVTANNHAGPCSWLTLGPLHRWRLDWHFAKISSFILGLPALHAHHPHPQALERLAGLLEEAGGGGLVIAERGDSEGVPRHPAFRLFGAMNPATDAGGQEWVPLGGWEGCMAVRRVQCSRCSLSCGSGVGWNAAGWQPPALLAGS